MHENNRFWDKTRPVLKVAGISISVLVGIVLLGFLLIRGSKSLRQALTSYPQPTAMTDDFGVEMMLVPAGEFQMGSAGYEFSADFDERPVHTVYPDTYYIDKYEVTNGLYLACVNAGVCSSPKELGSYSRENYFGVKRYSGYPVIHVDWYMATTYCEWRGARLPTEAQWEKAARGEDGRTYPWGEGLDRSKANYSGCVGDTTEVGSYAGRASPYGLYDMAGNVLEWTADWYDSIYYQSSPSSNPLGSASGSSRVLRGGSWNVNASYVRSANRNWLVPSGPDDLIGFRCSRSQ